MLRDFRYVDRGLGFEMPQIPILSSIPIIGGFFGHKKPKIAYRDIVNMVRADANNYGYQEAFALRQQAEMQEQVSEAQQVQAGVEQTRASNLLTQAQPVMMQFGKQGETILTVAPATVKKGK